MYNLLFVFHYNVQRRRWQFVQKRYLDNNVHISEC